jgi:hypothetical protein
MGDFIDRVLAERRTLERVLADLRTKYERATRIGRDDPAR